MKRFVPFVGRKANFQNEKGEPVQWWKLYEAKAARKGKAHRKAGLKRFKKP